MHYCLIYNLNSSTGKKIKFVTERPAVSKVENGGGEWPHHEPLRGCPGLFAVVQGRYYVGGPCPIDCRGLLGL